MRTRWLIILCGVAALAGGLFRILSAFIVWTPGIPVLELFYLLIDLLLLFSVMGIYFVRHERMSPIAFIGFVLAVSGFALITGPDVAAFGIDVYRTGVQIIMVGLALFSIEALRLRTGPLLASVLWVMALVIGVAGTITGTEDVCFFVAGIVFGAAFIAAGIDLLRGPHLSSA